MTETTEMIKAIANDSKVRIDRMVENYEQLEKENAELNEKLSEQKQYTKFKCNEAVKQKEVYEKEHFLLTKAKELLKQWLQANICDSVVLFSDTEQFLSEIDKC